MIAHYVLWVSLAIAAIVAVYGAYNYMLSTAVNFHTDELENAINLLAHTPIGETRQATISVPQGVTVDICGLDLKTNSYVCPNRDTFSVCGTQRFSSMGGGGPLTMDISVVREGDTCTASVLVKNTGTDKLEFDLGAGLALTGADPRIYKFKPPIYLGDVGEFGSPPHYTDISLGPGEAKELTFSFACPKNSALYFLAVAWRSGGEGWDLETKNFEDIIAYGAVRINAALACVRVARWDRTTFISLPYNATVVGPQRLHVGVYKITARHVTDPDKLKTCLLVADIITPIEVKLLQTAEAKNIEANIGEKSCEGGNLKPEINTALTALGQLFPQYSNIIEIVRDALTWPCTGSTERLERRLWMSYCTSDMVMEIEIYK